MMFNVVHVCENVYLCFHVMRRSVHVGVCSYIHVHGFSLNNPSKTNKLNINALIRGLELAVAIDQHNPHQRQAQDDGEGGNAHGPARACELALRVRHFAVGLIQRVAQRPAKVDAVERLGVGN